MTKAYIITSPAGAVLGGFQTMERVKAILEEVFKDAEIEFVSISDEEVLVRTSNVEVLLKIRILELT